MKNITLSNSSCSTTGDLLDSITYPTKRLKTDENGVVVIESSPDDMMDPMICAPDNYHPSAEIHSSFMIERETCQMSPLLFDSDTDDECSPLKCGQGSGHQVRPTPAPQQPPPPPQIPDNQDYLQIFTGLYNLSHGVTPTSTNQKKCSSEPNKIVETERQKSNRKNRFETPVVVVKDEDEVIEETPTRITRATARNSRIATRSKVRSGAVNMTPVKRVRHRHLKNRFIRSQSVLKPAKRVLAPKDDSEDSSLSSIADQNKVKLEKKMFATESSKEKVIIGAAAAAAASNCGKYDFDLSISSLLHRESDVQIISQRSLPAISISSLSDCPPAQGVRLSPDIFAASTDEAESQGPTTSTFLPKRKDPFYRPIPPIQSLNQLLTSTQRSEDSVIPSSLDLLRDPLITTTPTTSTSQDAANIFEITKNDVFPNQIRVTSSDSSSPAMSPIRVSEDEVSDEVDVAKQRATKPTPVTPRHRSTCLDGLTIQKRSKRSPDDYVHGHFAAYSSDEDDDSRLTVISTSSHKTPKRNILPKTLGRQWWSNPNKKITLTPTNKSASGSPNKRQQICRSEGSRRKWTKRRSDGPQVKQRRLDLWFTASGSGGGAQSQNKTGGVEKIKNMVEPILPRRIENFITLLSSTDDEK